MFTYSNTGCTSVGENMFFFLDIVYRFNDNVQGKRSLKNSCIVITSLPETIFLFRYKSVYICTKFCETL